jgi:hypothetical protein
VANTFTFTYWSSEQLNGEHGSSFFLGLGEFCKVFKFRRHTLILSSHSVAQGVWSSQRLFMKPHLPLEKLYLELKVGIDKCISFPSMLQNQTTCLWEIKSTIDFGQVQVYVENACPWVVFDSSFFHLSPLSLLFFYSSKTVSHSLSFLSGGWRVAWEPHLMDFVRWTCTCMTKVPRRMTSLKVPKANRYLH